MTHVFSRKTLLAFALLHFVLQGQICLLLQISLDFLLLQLPMMKKHLFGVSSKGLVGLHRRVQLHLLWHSRLGHRFESLRC